jgi:hypothetical protein
VESAEQCVLPQIGPKSSNLKGTFGRKAIWSQQQEALRENLTRRLMAIASTYVKKGQANASINSYINN